MPFGAPDYFVVEPLPKSNGWSDWSPPKAEIPEWSEDEEKKKQFGIELAKGHASPFQAACAVFDVPSSALWVSINWLNDPIVIAARDTYQKTLLADATLLDKNQLAARILQFADERLPNNAPALDAETRLKSFELYAKIQGFLKPDNSNQNNFAVNEMKVLVVSAEKPKDKSIEQSSIDVEDEKVTPLPLRIASVK